MIKFITGIGFFIIICLAVFYFISDPFSTKIDTQIENVTTWSPDRIQENPSGYFKWNLKRVQETITKIKSTQISINMKKAALEKKQIKKMKEYDDYKKTIDGAIAVYKLNNATFPLNFGDKLYSKEGFTALLEQLDARVSSLKKVKSVITKTLALYNKELEKLNISLNKAISVNEDLTAKIETVQLNGSSNELDAIQSNISSIENIIVSSEGIMQGSELDEIVKKVTKGETSEQNLKKILSKYEN